MNRSVGRFTVRVGILALVAAALVNPLTVSIWHGKMELNYRDVFASFAVVSAVSGLVLVAVGSRTRASRSRVGARVGLVLVVVAIAVCADRAVLAYLGLPIWTFDAEARFRHRVDAERFARGPHGNVWRTNSHGYHDYEFPVEKPAGEYRMLVVGDSITMGYILDRGDTFTERLEKLLDESDTKYTSHEVMNAGVAGYSTAQETVSLRRGLRFAPDLVVLGFCMNDVTEPYRVQVELGGAGIDYHGVKESPSPLLGWLMNETGFGRLSHYLNRSDATMKERRQREEYNVRDMTRLAETEPRYVEAWKRVFADLDAFYAVAKSANVPTLLLIFPYTIQLTSDAYCAPQRMLREHAERHGVDVLDLTPMLRDVVVDDELVERLSAEGKTAEEVLKANAERVGEYYIDSNHLTAKGHDFVAHALFEHLDLK